MDSRLRSLLRHIALGSPLVLAPTGALVTPTLLGCGHCEPRATSVATEYAYDSSGDEAALSCEAVCAARMPGGDSVRSCVFRDAQTVSCVRTERVECGGAGRLPLARTWRGATPLASPRSRWLTETATLELAAVPAFAELGRALERHGAPPSLVRRARRAEADEVRHARTLIGLAALDAGHARAEARADITPTPTLEALALHNAAEGCVREALGAIEAAHQARHAADARLRSAMAGIARDEARHALLSLDIDAWARARVWPATRRRLDEARRVAGRALRATPSERAPGPRDAACPDGDLGLLDTAARAHALDLIGGPARGTRRKAA